MAEEKLPEDLDDLSGARIPEDTSVPEEEPATQQPNIVGRGLDAKYKFDQANEGIKKVKGYGEKYKNWRAARADNAAAKKAGKEGLKEGVEKQGAAAAKRKVATQGAEGLAKAGVKTAATTGAKTLGTAAVVGAEAAAGPPGWVLGALTILSIFGKSLLKFVKNHWQYAVYAVAALFLLLSVPLGLLGGKGVDIKPTTAAQLFQAQAILPFIGGDFVASGGKINQKVYDAEKKRYAFVQRNVDSDKTVSGRSAEVKKSIDEILKLIESGIGVSGEPKKKITATALDKVKALDSTLPFGEWIAKAAEDQVGQPSGNFCRITGAEGSKACASFVTTVLQSAGIPTPLEPRVDDIWKNPAFRLLVNRLPNINASYYQQSKTTLQRGDIIFWGNGACNDGGSVTFDHVGFYVGNDQAVDNSSGNKKKGIAPQIRKRGAASRSSCIVFNGAKRYGAAL